MRRPPIASSAISTTRRRLAVRLTRCTSLGRSRNTSAARNQSAKRESGFDFAALLSHITDGMSEDEVDWVSPDELMKAADRLRELVLAQDPRVKRIIATYGLSANRIDSVHQEFAQDLADVRLIAKFSKEMGVPRMTLEVNW